MEPKLSKYLMQFYQNHNTGNALLRMIETWHAIPNERQTFGGIIRELSKALDNKS